MERQNRILTVLATVLLILVAIVVFGKAPEDDAGDPDAPPKRALFEGFEEDAAESLTLVNPSGTLTFAKKDGDWVMTAPKEMAVEQRRVEEIVDRFASLEVQEQGFDGELAGFGLDAAARVEVTIGAAGGKTLTAYVGRDAPVGYRSYIADKAEGPALLASSKVGDLVRRTADDFRSREVWKVSMGSGRRIRIEESGAALVVRKDDHGWWIGDDGPRAAERKADDWLTRAGMLRVDAFEDAADPAAVGLAPPAGVLTVEDDAGTHTLELGTRDEAGVYARTNGQIVRLGPEALELLVRDGWTADALMPVRRAQVDAIEVTLGAKSARFTKADGVWKDGAGAETGKAETLLDTLFDAIADRTAAVGAPGATWGAITLSEGTTRTEKITLGQEVGDGRAATDAAGGPPFRVPAATIIAVEAALN